jgi:hypothetical protein
MTGDGTGLGGLVLWTLGLVAISAPFLVAAIATLAVPRWRARLPSRAPLLVVTVAVLAVPAAIFLVSAGPGLAVGLFQEGSRRAEDHPVAREPTVIAGISFPPETALEYERNGNGTRRLIAARPPHPLAVGGLELSEVRLSEYDPRELQLRLAHDERIEDWPCGGREWARFYSVQPDQALSPSNWTFMSCPLVWDFQLGAIPVSGLTVAKLRDGSGWQLQNARLNDTNLDGVAYEGFTLKDYFTLYVDTERRPTRWTSVLARAARIGDIQYPPGVHVSGYVSGARVFEGDARGVGVDVRTGKELEGCVLQDASGRVLGASGSCSEAEAKASGELAQPSSR